MDHNYRSYWLAFIILSGIFYIIFGASYAIFGFRGFLILASIFFILSILNGLWYSITHIAVE
jgi:hypothetical protein